MRLVKLNLKWNWVFLNVTYTWQLKIILKKRWNIFQKPCKILKSLTKILEKTLKISESTKQNISNLSKQSLSVFNFQSFIVKFRFFSLGSRISSVCRLKVTPSVRFYFFGYVKPEIVLFATFSYKAKKERKEKLNFR